MSTKKRDAREVLQQFFDENSFVETNALLKGSFGEAEAITGYGTVDGVAVYAYCQDVTRSGGAMSVIQSKKINAIYRAALKTGAPVVGFFDSIGGRLGEKYELMNGYGEILKSSAKLSGVVPRFSVVLGSCLGTSAMIAASSDFVLMTKDSALSVDPLGENASPQANLNAGIASVVVDDDARAIKKARELLSYLPSNNLEPAPAFESVSAYENPEHMAQLLADCDSLFGVRCGYSDNTCTPFGRIGGITVGFVRTKGGVLEHDDCLKITKMVRFCDAFSIPIITIVDAEGFSSLDGAAAVSSAYAEATCAKISVITGSAIGGVYIALAGATSNSDAVFAKPDAIVSPIKPLAAALMLSDDIADAPADEQEQLSIAFVKENLTGEKAAEDGYVTDLVDESDARMKVLSALEMLSSKRVATLPKKHTTAL